MNTKITLTDAEQKLAIYLGKKRHQAARGANVKNVKIGPQPDEQTDLEGIAAEIAFCKLVNSYPDLDVGARSGGYDCILHSGKTVDVKATTYKTGRLLAPLKKTLGDSDIYVLMVGEFPSYEFKGWAKAEDLINENSIITIKTNATYGLSQGQLSADLSVLCG